MNPYNLNDYIFENENARLLMKDIIHKICIPTTEEITESMALKIYNHITQKKQGGVLYGDYMYVPCYNL